MAKIITDNQYYTDIANAIRSKNGSTDTYKPSEMASAIENIIGSVSNGESSDVVISPTYQGLSYCYLTSSGYLYSSTNNDNYLNIFELKNGNTYFFFSDKNLSNRERISFFAGKKYSDDFKYYIFNASSAAKEIYSGEVIYCNNLTTINENDSNDLTYSYRYYYTPSQDGILCFGTSNNSTEVKAYCVCFDNVSSEDSSNTIITTEGITLPKIPANGSDDYMTSDYKFAFIRKNNTSGYYDLILSKYRFYYYSDSGFHYVDYYNSDNVNAIWYTTLVSNITSWTFKKTTTGYYAIDTNRTVVWSSDSILTAYSVSEDYNNPYYFKNFDGDIGSADNYKESTS